jgi:hypothetical protein
MLMAALVTALVSVIAPIVAGSGSSSEQFAFYLWVSLVGTLGAWAVLIVTKFSEGRIEDQAPMRTLLLVSGAGVGVAAWALASMMMLGLPMDAGNGPNDSIVNELLGRPDFSGGTETFGTQGILPGLATFVVYFALVFVLIPWWRQAEYTRSHRIGLWSVAWSVLFAFILHFVWWFPQPSGMIVAGVIAIATQLSSPWLPPSGRRAITDAMEADVPLQGG